MTGSRVTGCKILFTTTEKYDGLIFVNANPKIFEIVVAYFLLKIPFREYKSTIILSVCWNERYSCFPLA